MLPSFVPPVPPGGSVFRLGAGRSAGPSHVGYCDGAIKSGQGTCGFVLYDGSRARLHTGSFALPGYWRDSNVPEIYALCALLSAALSSGVTQLVVLTDSYQVVEALLRQAAGRGSRYPELAQAANLAATLHSVEIRNIANRHNKEADALCARARGRASLRSG